MAILAKDIIVELKLQSDPVKAGILQGFFKTGLGEYGEGDFFLGVVVPRQRLIAKKSISISFKELRELLTSKYHEARFTAVVIMTYQYLNSDVLLKRRIYEFYLKNTKYINNWDLVDVSCPDIVGAWTFNHDRAVIYKLAKSKNLWERRMSALACLYYIRRGQADDILLIAEKLMVDQHDLIHKAVGWMLREMGKYCGQDLLRAFLNRNANKMPRTMLRYAIERFPEPERKKFLRKD